MPKIFIAEDDEAMREFFTHLLLRQGHTVNAVSNGADALKTLGGTISCSRISVFRGSMVFRLCVVLRVSIQTSPYILRPDT